MAIIGLQKGSGKRSRVREKSVKSQGILIWIMSGNPVLLDLCDARKKTVKVAGFVEERGGHGAPIQFTGSPGIYQYHNENIPVIEMKCDLFPNHSFRQEQ